MVASYTGLNFHEVGALEYVQYLTYRRDAYIYCLEQTEAGREYLANARRLEQTSLTSSSRSRLRELFGPKGPDGGDHASHRT